MNKRIIKSPKLYFLDTGLACSLLMIKSPDMINTHYLKGALFENLIISDILKQIVHRGKHERIYFWRESNGNEIDCVIEKDFDTIIAIEIKAGQSFNPDYLKNFRNFQKLGLANQSFVLYQGDMNQKINNIELVSWKNYYSWIDEILV